MIPDLDALGILHGTDKSSLNHGYMRHYERLLGNRRHDTFTLLEIGVFRGASLAAWEAFLPHATIVGLDINADCAQYAGGRRVVEIGSQVDTDFLKDVMRRWQPDVIVDDGSHLADHVILTFQTLYPLMQPGGLYIVEDIQFHAGPGADHWRNGSPHPPQDALLHLARMVSCPGTETDVARDLMQLTDTVEFFYGGVAIRRRPHWTRAQLETRRQVVEQANRPKTWAAFALHLFNNTRDLADARACVQRAIDAESTDPDHRHVLSLILESAGDLPGAVQAAAGASHLNPADRRLDERLRALEARYETLPAE